jgi:hypothetical protein
MHFRNGAMAFTYMSTMLLELVDQKKVSLDAKLSQFFPDLPSANRITLKQLANMTSGYADYVYQPELTHALSLDPFKQWSSDDLIRIGTSKPLLFEPGTNFAYSHTNYVILGRVLEMITGLPLATAMQKYICVPLDLKQTQSIDTPEIPAPVLHTFSAERRGELGVPTSSILYEESTFWNPSWTTAEGAVQTTDINDLAKSIEAVGTGKLLSKESSAAQINPTLVGFGHPRFLDHPNQKLRRLRRYRRLSSLQETNRCRSNHLFSKRLRRRRQLQKRQRHHLRIHRQRLSSQHHQRIISRKGAKVKRCMTVGKSSCSSDFLRVMRYQRALGPSLNLPLRLSFAALRLCVRFFRIF